MSMHEFSGHCDPAFRLVLDAFDQNFKSGSELGAGFTVYIDGNRVVDIYGGYSDRQKQVAWSDNSLTCIFSSGKAVITFLIAKAVNDGFLAYDMPIAHYWPEFGAQGKERITLAEVLSHQAGLSGLSEEMSPDRWLDWTFICERLAAMQPLWEPGTAHGYHPQTFGFIAGEVYRRVTGNTMGQALLDYGFDIHCGLNPENIARTAYMPKPPKAPDLGELNLYTQLAFLKSWSSPSNVSREDWIAAEMPASNMHATANALAAIVHPMANDGKDITGTHLLSDSVLDDVYRERCRGQDFVVPFEMSWATGVMRNINGHFGPNSNALGQSGFGGSAVVMDRDHRMSIAYVMNKMSPALMGDPRSLRLVNAVYECL